MARDNQESSPSTARSETQPRVHHRRLARLRKLAHLLDSSVPLPGGYRIGLDGIIGLLPGVGDGVGALLSSYILLESQRLGVSTPMLLRMALNVLVDAAVGVVPLAGDLFDFAWKANRRNMALLEAHLGDGRGSGGPSA